MTQDLIKRPGVDINYAEDQLFEVDRCSSDPIYCMEKYFRIQHATRGEIPFKMYAFQKEMIRGYLEHRWNIVLTSRQVGKTVTAACYLLWYAMFREDSNILITSRRNQDAMDIVAKVRYAYEAIPDWLRPGVREYSKHHIVFDNDSRIFSETTTENTGRGQAITILYLDEFAFVPPGIAEQFWASITPTLSTGGDCIITSTPNGDEDTFSSLWVGAVSQKNGFHPFEVQWDEHPDRDEDFKLQTISKIGELRWRQEYENEFLSSNESLISATRLIGLASDPNFVERNGFRFWEDFQEGAEYVIGVDPGTGTGGDNSTIQCFKFPELTQAAEFMNNRLPTPMFTGKLVWLLKEIEKAGAESYYSVENNGVGEGVIATLQQLEDIVEEDIPGTMIHDSGRTVRGLTTTPRKKLAACMELKNLLDRSSPKLHVKSRRTITELKFYIRKGPSFEARIGATDDLVAALLIMLRVTKVAAEHDLEAFDQIYSMDEEILGELDEDGTGEPDMPILL